MQISIQNFEDLLQWAEDLAAIMKERQKDDIVKQIEEVKKSLSTNVFTLAVLGKAKRGKSTLINALLGRHDDLLAPIDKLPASSAITRFRRGDADNATVWFKDNRVESVQFSRIKEFVTEEYNPENTKNVALVEVVSRFEKLPPQVELVDTPGAGSIHEHHDALLHAFIPQADAIIFIVTARMPLDQDEIDLLKEVKNADIKKIFFVVNKVDESEVSDVESAVQHNRKLLEQNGIAVESFHRISAKNAFIGKESDSNVPELMNDIGQFLAKNKGQTLRQRFMSRINAIVESELRSIEVAVFSSSKSINELNTEIEQLRQQKKSIEVNRKSIEREFELKWTDAVNALQSKLNKAEREVTAKITEEFNKTSMFGVSNLTKSLPTLLNKSFYDVLTPMTQKFESDIRDVCAKLDESYPMISIDDAGHTIFKNHKDGVLVASTIGGITAAAAGVSLVSAGSAAAASIAAANAAASSSLLGVVGSALSSVTPLLSFLGPQAGAAVGTVGTIASAISPPMLATPLWVALSGPVGWTLAGVGALAVPFAWRHSKIKQKDKLETAAQNHIKEIFNGIRDDSIPALQNMGRTILESFRIRLDKQIDELEFALTSARDNRPNESELAKIKYQGETLNRLITQSNDWFQKTY
ncbi:MAG: dynamin family protein [Planctomycetaceae bacterium]|jgi:predicted GTPase|nr:dynamin family protein [Planctomycetaceae bacterium]